jgi:hypothetical protein
MRPRVLVDGKTYSNWLDGWRSAKGRFGAVATGTRRSNDERPDIASGA